MKKLFALFLLCASALSAADTSIHPAKLETRSAAWYQKFVVATGGGAAANRARRSFRSASGALSIEANLLQDIMYGREPSRGLRVQPESSGWKAASHGIAAGEYRQDAVKKKAEANRLREVAKSREMQGLNAPDLHLEADKLEGESLALHQKADGEEEIARAYTPAQSEWKNVHGLGDAATWAGHQIGAGARSSLSLLPGMALSAVNPWLGAAAMGVLGYDLNQESNISEAYRDPAVRKGLRDGTITEQDVLDNAGSAAIPQSALDAVLFLMLMGGIRKLLLARAF